MLNLQTQSHAAVHAAIQTGNSYSTGVVCHIEDVGEASEDEQDSLHEQIKVVSDQASSDQEDTDEEFREYYTELPRRYKLVAKIGEGAFSRVFKALDTACDEYVAIKVIDKKGMKTAQIDSAMKEIAIMRRLRHHNIVKLYGYQNSQKSRFCFLFLEYVAGGEIFNQIIKYTYFSENLARHVIRQLAQAVKYLHDSGVVHRDIKPENILFTPVDIIPRDKEEQFLARRKSDDNRKIDEGQFVKGYGSAGIGTAKLADFGLSTVLATDDMRAKTPCGTVGYTSPEQHLNMGYTKKVDLWAIGCVLYTLVVGFPPFYSNSGNSKDISIKVARGEYKFLSPWFDEVSQECKNLISNLLTVDPNKRHSIDDLLMDPWMTKGYEDEIPATKSSVAAADAPSSTTFDQELFSKFTHQLVTENNVDDYFGVADQQLITTPRAEAIRLVFNTGTTVQRASSPMGDGVRFTRDIDDAMDSLSFAGIPRKTGKSAWSLSSTSEADGDDDDDGEDDDDDDDDNDDDSDDDDDDDDYDDDIESVENLSDAIYPPRVADSDPTSYPQSFLSSRSSCSFNLSDQSPHVVGAEIADDQTGSRRRSSVSFQLKTGPVRRNRASSNPASNTLAYLSSCQGCYPKSPCPKNVTVESQECSEGFDNAKRIPKMCRRPTPYIRCSMDEMGSMDALDSANCIDPKNEAFDLKLEASTILNRRRLSTSVSHK
ncbi:DEKNAAC100301 [Brettanomyces naardenensis]|uniref:DEKNAAC100301 n=1 Tax=Brettanomyces naardenensis TaxID=13370 RepID=A0A448YGM1_BRENA|nr:DEKNAAC100301 [Brettanomyces naardenensis]